jgi:hypothetical protein
MLTRVNVEEAHLPTVTPDLVKHWLRNASSTDGKAFLYAILDAMAKESEALVALVLFLSSCAGSSHAFADRSIELSLQLGLSRSVFQATFGPDGT